ncbi:MAG TPA: hypothetical protein VF660_06705 [Actinomycetota bacterium]
MNLPRQLADLKVTPLKLFGVALVLMVAAAVAVAFGHFAASPVAPWISIGLSIGSVACAVGSLLVPVRRP